MKICPSCQESNHDAAELCMLCGSRLPVLPIQPDTVASEDADEAILMPVGPREPPSGTLAVALYHDIEPRVVHYHPVRSDTTLLGREDAAQNIFPDLDVGHFAADGVGAEHVSRRHAYLVRRGSSLELEVLPGSTGTQVNRDLVAPGAIVAVAAGDRIILGSRVRLKLVQF